MKEKIELVGGPCDGYTILLSPPKTIADLVLLFTKKFNGVEHVWERTDDKTSLSEATIFRYVNLKDHLV